MQWSDAFLILPPTVAAVAGAWVSHYYADRRMRRTEGRLEVVEQNNDRLDKASATIERLEHRLYRDGPLPDETPE